MARACPGSGCDPLSGLSATNTGRGDREKGMLEREMIRNVLI